MREILNNDISFLKDKECYILFYFTAKWCGPCQKIKPLLQKISDGADPSKLKVFMIDIDENDELAKEFNVRSYPTVFGVANGEKVEFNNKVTEENLNDFFSSLVS